MSTAFLFPFIEEKKALKLPKLDHYSPCSIFSPTVTHFTYFRRIQIKLYRSSYGTIFYSWKFLTVLC